MKISYSGLDTLWRARWRILGGTMMGLLIGCAAVLSIQPEYTVKMVVGPVSANGTASMGTPAAHLNEMEIGNASMANPESLSDYDRYLQLLTSPSVAENLISHVPGILPLFFPDKWDAKKKEWVLPWQAIPAEIINRARGGAAWQAPTADDLSSRLKAMLQQRVIGATPMRELRLRHADRGFAITLLYAMHQAADNVLREEAERRSVAISHYIEKQLETVKLQEHRQVLSEMLAAQERIRILVSVDLPYAADIIQPPATGQQPDTPQPWPIIIFGGLAGFILTAIFSSLRISAIFVRRAKQVANRNERTAA